MAELFHRMYFQLTGLQFLGLIFLIFPILGAIFGETGLYFWHTPILVFRRGEPWYAALMIFEFIVCIGLFILGSL